MDRFSSFGSQPNVYHKAIIPLAFFWDLPWYFGKGVFVPVGGHVTVSLMSSTKGVYLIYGPSFCVRKLVPVMAVAGSPRSTLILWLRVPGMLSLALPGSGTPLMVALVQGLPDGIAEPSLDSTLVGVS